MSSAHGYGTKVFPLTAAQGRVLYQIERLFRSTGAGLRAHAAFLDRCGYSRDVSTWTDAQCAHAMRIMEACAEESFGRFRDCSTGRQDFMPGGRFYREAMPRTAADRLPGEFR